MKRAIAVLCAAVCLLCCLCTAYAANNNLLTNGGFEEITSSGAPKGWYETAYRSQEGYSRIGVTDQRSHSGGLISCLSEGNGALLQVCCKYGQEEFELLDLDSLDAAGELLNCVNGLYASGLSRNGKFLELLPPDYTDVTAKAKTAICKIPVYIGDKKFYFTVAELA